MLSLRRATSNSKVLVAVIELFLSTLSLRRATIHAENRVRKRAFLSTLSLRRATEALKPVAQAIFDFYPRSPCGERLRVRAYSAGFNVISIHALLAESDGPHQQYERHLQDFYPRSPCGERPFKRSCVKIILNISIHALLAESDAAPI